MPDEIKFNIDLPGASLDLQRFAKQTRKANEASDK